MDKSTSFGGSNDYFYGKSSQFFCSWKVSDLWIFWMKYGFPTIDWHHDFIPEPRCLSSKSKRVSQRIVRNWQECALNNSLNLWQEQYTCLYELDDDQLQVKTSNLEVKFLSKKSINLALFRGKEIETIFHKNSHWTHHISRFVHSGSKLGN